MQSLVVMMMMMKDLRLTENRQLPLHDNGAGRNKLQPLRIHPFGAEVDFVGYPCRALPGQLPLLPPLAILLNPMNLKSQCVYQVQGPYFFARVRVFTGFYLDPHNK